MQKSWLYSIECLNDKVDTHMHSYIQIIFRVTHLEEKVWPGGIQPTLLPYSSYVCLPSFNTVAPGICMANVPFFGFFFLNECRNRCGHIDI